MDLNKPLAALTAAEKQKIVANLDGAKQYGRPRKVWVEDGHVFLEGHDGLIVRMTPEVAIEMGRMLEQAGSDSLVNRVMDEALRTAR